MGKTSNYQWVLSLQHEPKENSAVTQICLFWDGKIAIFTICRENSNSCEISNFPVSKQAVKVQLSHFSVRKVEIFRTVLGKIQNTDRAYTFGVNLNTSWTGKSTIILMIIVKTLMDHSRIFIELRVITNTSKLEKHNKVVIRSRLCSLFQIRVVLDPYYSSTHIGM